MGRRHDDRWERVAPLHIRRRLYVPRSGLPSRQEYVGSGQAAPAQGATGRLPGRNLWPTSPQAGRLPATMPAKTVTVQCPLCGGPGTTKCWICQGAPNYSSGWGKERRPCLECGGTGRQRCTKCDGTGKIGSVIDG